MTEPTDERLLELAEKAQESVDRDGGQSAFSADVARLRMACSPDRIRALVEGKRRAEEERDRAKVIIEGYELDYERLVVRGEKCAMELAESDRDLLRARVEQLEEALQTELNDLLKRNEGRTHYPGCEKEHPMCAAIGRIRTALPHPERGGGA
jgi:hypothetical protein